MSALTLDDIDAAIINAEYRMRLAAECRFNDIVQEVAAEVLELKRLRSEIAQRRSEDSAA